MAPATTPSPPWAVAVAPLAEFVEVAEFGALVGLVASGGFAEVVACVEVMKVAGFA